MNTDDNKVTWEELKSFRYMFKQSPVFATTLIVANILAVVALGLVIFI